MTLTPDQLCDLIMNKLYRMISIANAAFDTENQVSRTSHAQSMNPRKASK